MASLTDSMDALTTAAPPFVCGITREMPEKPVESSRDARGSTRTPRRRAAGKTALSRVRRCADSRHPPRLATRRISVPPRTRDDAAATT